MPPQQGQGGSDLPRNRFNFGTHASLSPHFRKTGATMTNRSHRVNPLVKG
jgi:hypothetical protein